MLQRERCLEIQNERKYLSEALLSDKLFNLPRSVGACKMQKADESSLL